MAGGGREEDGKRKKKLIGVFLSFNNLQLTVVGGINGVGDLSD